MSTNIHPSVPVQQGGENSREANERSEALPLTGWTADGTIKCSGRSDWGEGLLPLIHADLRSAMNGVAAKTIRESGMGYKLVYGVELPRLREIAAQFTPDRRLAQALWQEDIRECKLLAIMLYPLDEFDADVADLWVSQLQPSQAELAQLLCMDLLAKAPYATEQTFLWMADERPMYQLCGFLMLTRLLMQGAQLSPAAEDEFLDQAAATLPTSYLPLRKAVNNALLRYSDSSEEAQDKAAHILCT